jgi:hypothetical protein
VLSPLNRDAAKKQKGSELAPLFRSVGSSILIVRSAPLDGVSSGAHYCDDAVYVCDASLLQLAWVQVLAWPVKRSTT